MSKNRIDEEEEFTDIEGNEYCEVFCAACEVTLGFISVEEWKQKSWDIYCGDCPDVEIKLKEELK